MCPDYSNTGYISKTKICIPSRHRSRGRLCAVVQAVGPSRGRCQGHLQEPAQGSRSLAQQTAHTYTRHDTHAQLQATSARKPSSVNARDRQVVTFVLLGRKGFFPVVSCVGKTIFAVSEES